LEKVNEYHRAEMEKINSIDQYIASFPKTVQQLLQQIRATIQAAAPEATEAISYAMPTFKLNGNLVHFAGYNNHIGFYPTPSGIEPFKEELASYKCSKGAIQFPIDAPLPVKLIRKIVLHRVQINQSLPVKKKS
jgi:uncharacterized protein YdhG (YjbR/CyaY superfamily)